MLSACGEMPTPIVEEHPMTLEIKLEKTSGLSYTATVVPSEDTVSYYCNIMLHNEFVDDETLKLQDMVEFGMEAENSGKSLSEVISSHIFKGERTFEYDNLLPGIRYYVYAYRLNADGIAKEGVEKAEIVMAGYSEFAIGDYFMYDGTIVKKDTYLTEDMKANVAGVIFYVGNPAAEGHDTTLGKEHPECINGLVMAKDTIVGAWAKTNKFIAPWVERDGRYISISGMEGMDTDQSENSPYNFIRGYNNTQALKAWNEVASEQEKCNAVIYVEKYAETHQLPYSTSGWYLPSVKELSLMIVGEYGGDIWNYSNEKYELKVLPVISESLSVIDGVGVEKWQTFESSTEHSSGIIFSVFYNGKYAPVGGSNKIENLLIRPVFAF